MSTACRRRAAAFYAYRPYVHSVTVVCGSPCHRAVNRGRSIRNHATRVVALDVLLKRRATEARLCRSETQDMRPFPHEGSRLATIEGEQAKQLRSGLARRLRADQGS
jgi:hypothetical protein